MFVSVSNEMKATSTRAGSLVLLDMHTVSVLGGYSISRLIKNETENGSASSDQSGSLEHKHTPTHPINWQQLLHSTAAAAAG